MLTGKYADSDGQGAFSRWCCTTRIIAAPFGFSESMDGLLTKFALQFTLPDLSMVLSAVADMASHLTR